MMISMARTVVLAFICFSSFWALSVSGAGSPPAPILPPAPAPAPMPDYVNITDLLSVAGPFHTFLNYLVSTKVIDTFQDRANNTEEGITIFVPKDSAFTSLQTPLKNLTNDQLKSLLLFHALPHYYSLSDFKNLSTQVSPVNSLAGYPLNFTDDSGTVHINSQWTLTKVSSSVHASDPVAIYQVDKVLLPTAIFGTDIPPTAAPAPAPVKDIGPAADSPGDKDESASSSPTSSPSTSSSFKIVNLGMLSHLILGFVAGGIISVMSL
ncbi:cell adhesion molecule [Lithospermum erythrorhizon]|uniref:Cell adhesion molecule n=1 Tax=Lithospermum erythrorhizon TaxID=34254 RepID=A0AAV3NYM9_LITER